MCVELGEFASFTLDVGERLLECAFERAGNEPVFGFAGLVLTPRAVGLKLGAFQREVLLVNALVVVGVLGVDRCGGGVHAGGRDRFEGRVGNGPVQPQCADRLARPVPCSWCVREHRYRAVRPLVPE
jgi:hypothetical protein